MRTFIALSIGSLLAIALSAAGDDDVLRVGFANVTSPGKASLPVYFLDLPGSPLGFDVETIRGLALSFVPSRPGLTTAFRPNGVFTQEHPSYERSVTRADGGSGYLARGVNGFLFHVHSGIGDRIGTLDVTIPPGIPAGTRVELGFDPSRCMLWSWNAQVSEGQDHLVFLKGAVVVGAYWGDATADGTIDVFDLVTLANAIAGNLQPGHPPFVAGLDAMNLNPAVDGVLDVFDLVLLAGYLVGNVPSIPVP